MTTTATLDRTPVAVSALARWLLPLGVATACYAPTPPDGVPCSTACPMPQVCVDGTCRDGADAPDAAPDAPAIPDRDRDTVADADDNCPRDANLDQSDEDGDRTGDACDPCPHLASPEDDADADGDGVGTGCDPEPTVPRQRLVFFDSFNSARAGWSLLNAQREAGRLHVLDGRATLTMMTGELRIIIAGTVDAVVGTDVHQLLIMFGANLAGANFHYAELYDDPQLGGSVNVTKAASGTYSVLARHPLAGAIPTGRWSMVIDESLSAQRVKVAGTVDASPFPALVADTRPAPALTAGTELHVATNHADVRVDYIAVIRTAP